MYLLVGGVIVVPQARLIRIFFPSCSTSGNIASLLKPRIKDPAGTAALAEARAVHTKG